MNTTEWLVGCAGEVAVTVYKSMCAG